MATFNRPLKRRPLARRPGAPGVYHRDRRIARKTISADSTIQPALLPPSGSLPAPALPAVTPIHSHPSGGSARLDPLDDHAKGGTSASALQAIGGTEAQIEEFHRDINAARELQLRMLPSRPPRIPGYEASAFFEASDMLAGDFFQFIDAGAGRTGFLIADVAGHGLTAAMIMASTLKTITLHGRGRASPLEVLCAVCHEMAPDLPPGRFVTVFYGVLEHATGEFRYVRAGHNPALLARPDTPGILELTDGGVALGLCGPDKFRERVTEGVALLTPGSTLLLYSDGITEARNNDGDEYGDARLRERFAALASQRTRPIVEQIVADMRAHAGEDYGEDDLTLLAVKRD